MEIVFATSNVNKAAEVRHILNSKIRVEHLALPEIQSLSVKEIAGYKARIAHRELNVPVVVEDTGLYLKGFGGFPGALAKWFVKGLGYNAICRAVDTCNTRDAYAETCVAYYDGKRGRLFTGKASGKIAETPQGSNNFGWDRIFIPKGSKRTFAQMSIKEKSRISMRGIAVRKLGAFLKEEKFI